MLSIQNPPLDPPSHLQNTNLNNGLDQKKASSSSVQQDPDRLNPLPIFSIRDYVFSSRSKALSKNWPFSKKHLELCMKHGVSDPLPPFQTPDSVRRNPFVKRKWSGEKFYCDDVGKIHDSDDGEIPNRQDGELNLGLCKENRAASDCLEINLCGSEEADTDFVSKNAFLKLEKHEGEEVITRHRHPPVKKSKLVKSTSEKTVVLPKNYTVMSESMASKGVCPVCKTFSSSSNTTLNAHIDQCLSGESTTKCAPSLPVTKYKVKPRKTRLMVDIYKSARHCTLEELERRNGRSWATNSSFQVQEGEVRFDEKVEKVSNVNVENDNGHEGDVYIDSDGTKVRILSKLSGVESGSKIGGDDNGARKLLKGDKVKKKNLLSIKKKKIHQEQKQQKSLKLGKNSLSRESFRNYEACGSGQERKEPIDEYHEKGEMQTESFKDNHHQIKKGNFGTTKKWSSSTIQKKTSSDKDVHQYSGHNSNINSELESGPSTSGKLHLKKHTHFAKNPISSPKSSQRTDIGERRRQMPERKCNSSSGSKIEIDAGSFKYSDAHARRKPSLSNQGSLSNAKNFSSLGKNIESVVDPTSDSEETSDDEEFAREEVETQMEQITEGIFMGLDESMNNPCDSEFFQGPVCRMEQTPMCEQETFCSQGQNSQILAEIEDSRAWQSNYFSDVNAISIPGPPGSFLPSLEDLGSEDYQGHSSLTTSRVQSSEEPHDHVVYRHSPDSLLSADSTISHPSLAGFDSKSSDIQTEDTVQRPLVDNYTHVQLPDVQTEETVLVPLVDNYTHVQLPDIQTEDTVPIPLVDKNVLAGAVFPEKRLKFDNLLCTSWKEGSPQVCSPISKYNDSLTLKRWSVDSVPPAPTGNQWTSGNDLNTRVGIPSFRTEIFNPLSSGAENADMGPDFPVKVSGDSANLSPASNYPVLRLMGKNLMVVNNDQDLPPLQERQNFDGRSSNNFISHVDPTTLFYASCVPTKTGGGGSSSSSSSGRGGGFTEALELHKYEGRKQFAN